MRRVTAILYLQIFLLPEILCHFKTVTKFSFHNINFVCNSSYDFYQWSFLYEGHLKKFFFAGFWVKMYACQKVLTIPSSVFFATLNRLMAVDV